MTFPWISREFFQLPIPPMHTRETFVAKYFPKYVEHYRPSYAIRMVRRANGTMYCSKSTPGSVKSQQTKRDNRIDAAYETYCAQYKATVEMESV